MIASPMRVLVGGTLAGIVLAVSACGGGNNENTGGAGPKVNPAEGKRGGTLRVLGSSDIDYIDPGHTYYTLGYELAFAAQRPLYSFKPGRLLPLPDLAESEPKISSDNKTVTVKIRTGVKFSPPVNREVEAKDVKYAFERFFTKNVGGQYATYFNVIQGAPQGPGSYRPISGIETPDEYTIVFKLSKPVGPAFAAALVMPITIPVPKEYAQQYDQKNPSTYNTHVVFSGPYMVQNDKEGNLVGYKPGKSIHLVRNPNWDAKTDFKPAYLDEIVWRTNSSDATVAARQVLNGSHMTLDSSPPASVLKDVVTKIKGQYEQVPSGGFRWFPLNTTVKPLDNLNVRKAILAAFDRDAARKARGGKFIGDLPTHFLPPGIPGFEEAGGFKGPGFDFLENPRGDMALATQYMKKAGYPSGKYTGNDTLLMVSANVDPNKAQAEVAKAQLEKVGLKVKLRLVPQDAVYTEYCQVPAKKVAVCGGAGWFKDFNDPQSMLEPTFKGSAINKEGGNNNMPQLRDPKIDAAMNKAAELTGEARNRAWGEIDKMITAQAPAVPFVWDKQTNVRSKDVLSLSNGYYTLWDFTWTSLK